MLALCYGTGDKSIYIFKWLLQFPDFSLIMSQTSSTFPKILQDFPKTLITVWVILPRDLHHFGALEREALDLWSCHSLSAPSCSRTRRPCQRHCHQAESQSPPPMSSGAPPCLYPDGIHHRGRVLPWNTPHCCGTGWWPGARRSSRQGRWGLWSRGVQGGDLEE